MNSIYRIIQNDDGVDKVLGHFTSKVIASVVLYQLNHRKESKEKYMKAHNVSRKYEPGLNRRRYYMDSVGFDDSSFQDVIRKESSVGQLKKLIYAAK